MPKKVVDKELRAYAEQIGMEEYKRQYGQLYQEAKQHKARYSGLSYSNSSDRLKSIREKYKNGISKDTVNNMLDKLLG